MYLKINLCFFFFLYIARLLVKGKPLLHSFVNTASAKNLTNTPPQLVRGNKPTINPHSLTPKMGFLYKFYCSMLYFNGYIFNANNLLPLKEILKKIYHKKVELNIINLKYLYLDSNMFAEAIAKKLKDRQKRVLRVSYG